MRRALLTLLIVVAVIGAGGYLADSWVRDQTEARAAAAIQDALGLAEKPAVTLGGFPFSLAFLTQSVPSARVTAEKVPITVSGTKAELSGVLVDSDTISVVGNRARIQRVTGTGVLGYAGLGDIAGVPISYAGEGRIALTYTARIAGQQLTVGVTAEPRLDVDAAVIRLVKPTVDPAAATQVALSQAQLQRLARPIPVELGKRARVTSLATAQGGIAVAVTASDVSLTLA
nr:DUF2993 domain-containing protein [Propionicimonas sp.]